MKYEYTTKGIENTEARVLKFGHGYGVGYVVTLWDLDSGNALPFAKIFSKLEDAIKNADTLV